MPCVRMFLVVMMSVLKVSCSFGNTRLRMSHSISNGTPGSDTNTLPSCENHIQGAVPRSLFSTSQQRGTSACARFTGVSSYPRLSKMRFTFSSAIGLSTNSLPKYSQSNFLVMSSLVGPRPPVTSTASLLCIASSTASQMACCSSPTTIVLRTSMPAAVSMWLIVEALVLTTCPISSSSPMLMIVMSIFPVVFGIGEF